MCLIIRCFQKSVVLDEQFSRVMMTLREGHQRPERKLSPVKLKVQLHGLNLSVELFTYNPPYSLSHKTLNVRENLCLWKSDVEWSRQDQTQLDSTSASSPSIFILVPLVL